MPSAQVVHLTPRARDSRPAAAAAATTPTTAAMTYRASIIHKILLVEASQLPKIDAWVDHLLRYRSRRARRDVRQAILHFTP